MTPEGRFWQPLPPRACSPSSACCFVVWTLFPVPRRGRPGPPSLGNPCHGNRPLKGMTPLSGVAAALTHPAVIQASLLFLFSPSLVPLTSLSSRQSRLCPGGGGAGDPATSGHSVKADAINPEAERSSRWFYVVASTDVGLTKAGDKLPEI